MVVAAAVAAATPPPESAAVCMSVGGSGWFFCGKKVGCTYGPASASGDVDVVGDGLREVKLSAMLRKNRNVSAVETLTEETCSDPCGRQ